MASGKHSRRKRRRKRSQSQHAPFGELLEQARQLLARGDGRGALDRLRQAQHAGGNPQELPLLFFCACVQRARQLARSGLDAEAAAMRTRAARHRESVSPRTLGEEDLVRYVRCLDGADALAVYADCLNARPPVLRAERTLADRLVIERGWEGLEALKADHPLRRDAGPVMRSLDAMDAGDWDRAADLLQSVPRRSPFAAWRVFCKAMVCFGADDDQGLRRCLDLLPVDFALAGTVAEWRRICTGEGEGGSVGVQRVLGTDGQAVEVLGRELGRALRENARPRDVERLMTRLADALCPEESHQVLTDLLQIAGLATLRSPLPMQTVQGLARRLLPPGRAPGLMARIGLLLQQASLDLWDPAPAVVCLDHLPAEFPGAEDRVLARARVLEALARTGHRAVQPEFLPPRMMKALSKLLGGRIDESGMLFVELMAESLEADPDNREGWRFLLDLLRGRRDHKPRRRSVLERMAARFPEDPEPWMELTALHYSSNAYRRAEHSLAEARRRAPHDERILDLQAAGFLRSADQSRKSGRFPLAARDLQRAEALGRPKLGTVLEVKRLLLEVVSAGRDAAAVVAPRVEHLPLAVRIRILALLLHDLGENRHVKNVGPEMEGAVRRLLAGEAPVVDELGPDEVVDLLAPLPADLQVLYNRLHVAPVLADWWAALMRRLEGDALFEVFDILLDCDGRAPIRLEIHRRLRDSDLGVSGPTRRDPLLLLYLAMIRYQEGRDHDSRRFAEALEAAEPSERERLRAASVRLARHAQGILREALQKSDFALLDLPPPLFGDGAPPPFSEILDALFDSPEPEPDPEEEPPLDEFLDALRNGLADTSAGGPRQESLFDNEAARELEALEALIDRHGLRGMPSFLLEEVAGIARAEPEIRHNLDRTARGCEAAGLRRGLRREARIFLFPRGQGRR
ncbi:MAG: hypothetical protein OXU81_14375 [Gammaproteobacteria bacterium]|nr:hypothetical protein [Gammaproteobacteria bacterium]